MLNGLSSGTSSASAGDTGFRPRSGTSAVLSTLARTTASSSASSTLQFASWSAANLDDITGCTGGSSIGKTKACLRRSWLLWSSMRTARERRKSSGHWVPRRVRRLQAPRVATTNESDDSRTCEKKLRLISHTSHGRDDPCSRSLALGAVEGRGKFRVHLRLRQYQSHVRPH